MKHLVIAGLAAASLAAAVTPALAQPYGAGGNINQREAQIAQRIDQGVRGGGVTRSEAVRLRNELRGIQNLELRYRRGGLTGWERKDLDRRLDSLSARVFDQRHDNDRRGRGGWGRH